MPPIQATLLFVVKASPIRVATPAAYAELIRNDYAKWGKVVAAAGIKPE